MLILEEDVLRLICGCATQSGSCLEEIQSFYDDLVMCMGDFIGHMGRHTGGFYGVHGGYGVG